jgi:CheY-like chemotaxis protein
MDGFEAARRLREHEKEEGTPQDLWQRIIGISANSEEEMELGAESCGMDAFMPVRALLRGGSEG